MKKVLFIATVVQKHINVFHLPFLKMFQENGYMTYVAAANDTEQQNAVIPYCNHYEEINFKRNPLHPRNISAYLKLRKLISDNEFDIIHCHTPVGGLLGRLAARKSRKNGTKVFYTAHGFHFYKGAPLKNWFIYYPVEKICSYFTDVLITINREDYALAKKKMKAKKVEYVPGVGIDTKKFGSVNIDKSEKRKELGISDDAVVMLSVGELNHNKNHEVVIKALAKTGKKNIHYMIAGKGQLKEYLIDLSEKLGISSQVHILGYRTDISELYYASDICVFPSIREGLGLGAIEGMSVGLPLIVSDNRGTRDYSIDNENAFICLYNDIESFSNAINRLSEDEQLRKNMGEKNSEIAKKFDSEVVIPMLKKLYKL